MDKRDAMKLHNEDEVIVKETQAPLYVIETNYVLKDPQKKINRDNILSVEVLLSDGNWYGHTEIY